MIVFWIVVDFDESKSAVIKPHRLSILLVCLATSTNKLRIVIRFAVKAENTGTDIDSATRLYGVLMRAPPLLRGVTC